MTEGESRQVAIYEERIQYKMQKVETMRKDLRKRARDLWMLEDEVRDLTLLKNRIKADQDAEHNLTS